MNLVRLLRAIEDPELRPSLVHDYVGILSSLSNQTVSPRIGSVSQNSTSSITPRQFGNDANGHRVKHIVNVKAALLNFADHDKKTKSNIREFAVLGWLDFENRPLRNVVLFKSFAAFGEDQRKLLFASPEVLVTKLHRMCHAKEGALLENHPTKGFEITNDGRTKLGELRILLKDYLN